MFAKSLQPLIILIILPAASVAATDATLSGTDDWVLAAEIVDSIRTPEIPRRDYRITDFGAAGDGKTDARPAILAAIDKAHADGGGRVVLPKGVWFSKGPIHLKSRIDLHLAKGATLLFSPEPQDYLPPVLTRWEGTELYSYSPLIYAANVQDVAITGKGLIDGNRESAFHQWTARQEPDQLKLRKQGNDGTPAAKRVYGVGTWLRPAMIQFFHAERVLLQDYTVSHAPFWVNHLVYTDHAILRNIRVDSHYPNNDGVDIESSTYVLVEHSWFRTGDDSVVVKSGRDRDGREIGRPSMNIVVRHNDMGGEDGIALGSEMSGGIRNVFFTDNILRKGSSAIRFKANLDRGGTVEHIRVRNMKIEAFDKHLFWFQLNYPGLLGGGHPATYRDIVFENITVERAGTVFEAHAPPEAPLKDVLLKNVIVKQAADTFLLENVEGLRLENVRIGNETINGVLDWKTASPSPKR
jgi:polygalacturonase